ncbi:hypothetical protein [Pseudofulvimonas gallinarii]|jgi:hypothetical protein|uniref:Uncharacterized protein n=3 Tax=Pseudofulvimonas gallinarii TaxID=634155 RepID=A0A4R3LJF7_9GAMM|nr:hypothetical protein [Pseudofulvimonas gallinarii]TCT00313.1 hypothetical protein EDC25_10381 [Pseudofulvimonas gallinarii]
MRMVGLALSGALALVAGNPVAVADEGFAGVRVEYAPKRSDADPMAVGAVTEKRMPDGTVVAALNGNAMAPIQALVRDGRLLTSCGEVADRFDFRARRRSEEQ